MWITEYRQRYGLALEELGAIIRRVGARKDPPLRVSDTLLYRLETEKNFRTVPKLADLIAEACGATAKQRDALVLAQYRGTWKPPRGKKGSEGKRGSEDLIRPDAGRRATFPSGTGDARWDPARERRARDGRLLETAAPVTSPPPRRGPFSDARVVVRVNRYGVETGRYRSCNYAAIQNCVTENQVTRRCHRRYRCDEFKAFGYTFRFAAEWDAMSLDQRLEDVGQMKGVSGTLGGSHGTKMVTVVDPDGNVWHYDSVIAAAEGTGISYHVLSKRLRRAMKQPVQIAIMDGYRLMYTATWDGLTEGQKTLIREQGTGTSSARKTAQCAVFSEMGSVDPKEQE